MLPSLRLRPPKMPMVLRRIMEGRTRNTRRGRALTDKTLSQHCYRLDRRQIGLKPAPRAPTPCLSHQNFPTVQTRFPSNDIWKSCPNRSTRLLRSRGSSLLLQNPATRSSLHIELPPPDLWTTSTLTAIRRSHGRSTMPSIPHSALMSLMTSSALSSDISSKPLMRRKERSESPS